MRRLRICRCAVCALAVLARLSAPPTRPLSFTHALARVLTFIARCARIGETRV